MQSVAYLQELERRPPLARALERRLVARARRGDDRARTELVEAFLPAIVSVSRCFEDPGVDSLELIQAGVAGLLRALEPGGPLAPVEAGYERLASTAERPELRRLLGALSARERAVLGALRDRGGTPDHEQAADRLGLPSDEVRRIERRARRKLGAANGTPEP